MLPAPFPAGFRALVEGKKHSISWVDPCCAKMSSELCAELQAEARLPVCLQVWVLGVYGGLLGTPKE